MKRFYLLLALSLAAALGFLSGGNPGALLIAGLGAGLLGVAISRRSDFIAAIGFILLVLAAALQTGRGGEAVLSLSSVCASLAAWDVSSTVLLLHRAGVPADSRLAQRRLLRLGIVLACGWILGGLALLLKLNLSFGLLLSLALFVVLSLSISMMYLRRRDQSTR